MNTAVDRIANWAAALSIERTPRPVVDAAIRCLIDTIAVAIPGAATPVAERAREAALASYAPGWSTVLGDTRRLAAAGAAFVNATAAHALDFDDNCYAGVVHGSAVVVPAALAATQAVDGGGRDMLVAFIAGVEAEYALGRALTMSIYERGMFTSSLLGVGGAAVSAARAMRLDAAGIAHALGLAMCGAGGVKACVGSDAKPLLLGHAAQAGIVAALLARAGATGPLDLFEHPRGFARLLGNGIFEASAIDGLGRVWSLLEPGIDIKRAPVCLSAVAALDGLLGIMAENRLAETDVETVECELSPISRANLAYDEPRTVMEAQFSLPFVLACALRHGEVGLRHLDQALLGDASLRNLMRRIVPRISERWASDSELAAKYPEGAYLVVSCRDGRRLERFVGAGRGTASQPLTNAELDAKFLACTGELLGPPAAADLLSRLRRVEELASIRDLL